MKTTITHTKGPWELNIDTVYIGDKIRVQPVRYHMDAEGIANARLISAAPDLLAACMQSIITLDPMDNDHAELYEQLRAAIAKAKGEA